MKTDTYQLADYIGALRRRLPLMLKIATPVALIATVFAIGLPDVYRSSAELRIDLEGLNVDILEPIALTRFADQYVASLEQKALSWDNRQNWIEEIDVYPDADPDASKSDLIGQMSDDFRIDMLTTPVTEPGSGKEYNLITGFAVGFDSAYPEAAYKVAERMAAAFLTEDRALRTARAATASDFLTGQIALKQAEIEQAESKLATFKQANSCCLPELLNLNMSIMDRTERELDSVQSEIRTLQQDRVFRVSQLEQIRQSVVSTSRLAELEEEYLQMVSVYGEDHPDLIKVRRQIAALTSGQQLPGETAEITRLQAELTALRERYSEEHPDVISMKRRIDQLRRSSMTSPEQDNPEYLQLRAQVNAIDTQLRGMRSRAAELRTKRDIAETNTAKTPQVEKELLALRRDLDTAQQAFQDLQNRLVVAQQTEAFESQERGARLTLVRGAFLPERPASPPRMAIFILGLFVAFTLSGAAGILAEGADTTVRGRRDIINLIHAEPITAVPIIQNSESLQLRRHKIMMMAGGLFIISVTVLLVSKLVM